MAYLYKSMGRYAEALPLFQQALKINENKLGEDHPNTTTDLNNLGGLYRAMGRYEEALPLFKRALEIKEKTLGSDHPDTAISLNNLAGLYETTGDWRESLNCFGRARRSARRHFGLILPCLSERHQKLYMNDSYYPFFHAALSAARAHAEKPAAVTAGAAWLLNGKAVAYEATARRLRLAAAGENAAAAKIARRLRALQAEMSKLAYNPAAAGGREQANTRLRTLREERTDLAGRLGRLLSGEEREDPWIALDEVQKALPQNVAYIDILRLHVKDFKNDKWLAYRYVAWVVRDDGVSMIDLGEAEAIDDAVAAYRKLFSPGAARTAAAAQVYETGMVLTRLLCKPLADAVKGADHLVISPDGPLWLLPWGALPADKGTYLIEDRQITYLVSGRALVIPPRRGTASGGLVFADPAYDMGIAAAARETREIIRQEKLLALSATRSADMADLYFPPLPGLAEEVKKITPRLEQYLGMTPRLYTRKKALEGVFKTRARPKVLVMCTHGFFLPDNPAPEVNGTRGTFLAMPGQTGRVHAPGIGKYENPLLRCGLALAGANNRTKAGAGADDGVLTGMEIIGSDLKGTDTVILSACDTGVGSVDRGEGVAGLRQSFHLAGAATVIATLWKIPDRETAALMDGFWAQLAAGKGKGDALRNTQLEMIAALRKSGGWANPYYWAAFTLTGQWDGSAAGKR